MAPHVDSRASRLAWPAGIALLGAGAAVALHLRDPHVQGSWGFCPFQVITGLDCPGCGGLRAVHHLTDLDLVAAASSNLLVVLLVPVLAVLWLRWVGLAWRGGPRRALTLAPVATALVLVVVLGFGVIRNLPGAAWLAA